MSQWRDALNASQSGHEQLLNPLSIAAPPSRWLQCLSAHRICNKPTESGTSFFSHPLLPRPGGMTTEPRNHINTKTARTLPVNPLALLLRLPKLSSSEQPTLFSFRLSPTQVAVLAADGPHKCLGGSDDARTHKGNDLHATTRVIKGVFSFSGTEVPTYLARDTASVLLARWVAARWLCHHHSWPCR